MDTKRKIALGFATLAVALGAGHMVQRDRGAARVAAAQAVPTHITPLAASAEQAAPAPALATLAPALPLETVAVTDQQVAAAPPAKPAAIQPTVPVQEQPVQAALTTDPAPTGLAPATPAPQATDACGGTLDVIPGANGMLDLTLISPCQQSTRVVLRHGGLAITARTSTGGALFTALPALDSAGEVAAMFPDGTIVRGASPVDLSGTQRFAVQWMADDRFGLNAFENGAAFGAPGHVHAAARGAAETGGWLIPLGDASVDLPMLAEVYTFPANPATVALDIEAAVTEATCDRDLLGETLDSRGGKVTPGDITLAMPDCSAVGDYLVLNNLVPGMTTAAAE